MIVDSVDAHLPEAGSIDKAARLPGQFLAWCANMQLLAPHFEDEHSRAVVRTRFRELAPSEFFIVTCGGELSDRVLNERGQMFAREHYGNFAADLPQLVDGGVYVVENEWWLYERASRYLNERLLGRPKPEPAWWQFWRKL